MGRKVIVLELSNVTDEQVQTDLGEAFSDFCSKNKGSGITASVLSDECGNKVKKLINGEA
jgi:hypothetical protein